MSDLIIRPATKTDLDAFSDMTNKPSVRGIVAELDGKIIALAGLAYNAGRWFAFCDLTSEARRFKVAIVKTARKIFDDARRDGIRFIYAEADANEPHAIAWLESLGFELDPRSQHLYRWSSK